MSDSSGNAPAGWYPDPAGSGQSRWWNGVEWTSHFAPAQNPAPATASQATSSIPQYGQAAPYGQAAAYGQAGAYGQANPYGQTYAQTRPQLSPGARIYNVYIWLVVALPFLSILVLPFFQPNVSVIANGGTYRARINPLDVFGPLYFVTIALSLVGYALTVLFAWMDYRELEKQGVVRPFHWAWAFLANYVYVIGRSVIVRQVAPRRGLAPIWVTIGLIVLGILVGVIWAIAFASNLMHSIPPGSSNLGA